MYTPHIMIDSRDLIRKKFMKKTHTHGSDTKSDPTISYVNEPDQVLDIDDSSRQDSDKVYNYLFDDPLSREFNYDETTFDDKRIFVCLYKQNNDLALPYITYSLIDYNNTLSFPNIDVSANPTKSSLSSDETIVTNEPDGFSEDEVTDEVTDEYSNSENSQDILPMEVNDTEEETIEKSQDILPMEENDTEEETIENNQDILPVGDEDNIVVNNANIENNMDEKTDDYLFVRGSQYIKNNVSVEDNIPYDCYKGFVELDGNIYTFFDATDIDFNDDFNDKTTNCTIDELMQLKKVPGLFISENISNLFNTENILKHICDTNNTPIYNPITVYLCEAVDDEYVNSAYSDTNNSMSLISEKIEHPIVGNTYLFTSKLLDTSNANIYKRYALFHHNAVYVLHEPFVRSEYDIIEDNSCVCFMSEGIEYWSVKNIDLFTEI